MSASRSSGSSPRASPPVSTPGAGWPKATSTTIREYLRSVCDAGSNARGQILRLPVTIPRTSPPTTSSGSVTDRHGPFRPGEALSHRTTVGIPQRRQTRNLDVLHFLVVGCKDRHTVPLHRRKGDGDLTVAEVWFAGEFGERAGDRSHEILEPGVRLTAARQVSRSEGDHQSCVVRPEDRNVVLPAVQGKRRGRFGDGGLGNDSGDGPKNEHGEREREHPPQHAFGDPRRQRGPLLLVPGGAGSTWHPGNTATRACPRIGAWSRRVHRQKTQKPTV